MAAAARLSPLRVHFIVGKLLSGANVCRRLHDLTCVGPAAAAVLHARSRDASLHAWTSSASREPLTLVMVGSAMLELVHGLLLGLIVYMLIEIA